MAASRTQVKHEIYTLQYSDSRQKMDKFMASEPSIKILSIDAKKRETTYRLVMTAQQFEQYKELVKTFGYIASSKESMEDLGDQIQTVEEDIRFLKNKLKDYETLEEGISKNTESHLSFWREMQGIKDSLRQKEHLLSGLKKQDTGYLVTLILTEEVTANSDNPITTYVNMPGFQYSFWVVEKPDKGISAKSYQGYQGKYMFTRGKNALYLGAYIANKSAQNKSTAYNDIFVLGFGQDFYSRYLGRGQRRFFNLTTGYVSQIMLMSSNEKKAKFNFTVIPSLGLDIHKGKYCLWDIRAGYILPIVENKNMRGLELSMSFAVVF
jgi:hypothetical protein